MCSPCASEPRVDAMQARPWVLACFECDNAMEEESHCAAPHHDLAMPESGFLHRRRATKPTEFEGRV